MSESPPFNGEAVADAVNNRMRELGWTQKRLADESDVSVGTISRLLNARRVSFRPQTLPALSKALGWQWDALDRIGRGEPFPAPPTSTGGGIRTRRIHLGMTLEEVAEATAISTSRLAALERGEASPRLFEQEALEDVFGGAFEGGVPADSADMTSRIQEVVEALNGLAREMGLRVEMRRDRDREAQR